MKKFIIRKMGRKDVDFAIDWAAREGWDPGINDADCFYYTDPNGFFIGELNGEPIGCISAVAYNDSYGFVGFFIVKPEYRGKLYGIYLGKKALEYLGNRNIGIDGVIDKVHNYSFYGFKYAYKNVRYEYIAEKNNCSFESIMNVKDINFEELIAYDNKMFPAIRREFLKRWINQPESFGFSYYKNKKVLGYGILRACQNGFKIGPLFADNEKIAEELFNVLTSKVVGKSVFLDTPEVNALSLKMAEKYGMKKVFETARMYSKNPPKLPMERIYGVTSFELG